MQKLIYKLEKRNKYEYVDDYLLYIYAPKAGSHLPSNELKNTFDSSEQAIRRKISDLDSQQDSYYPKGFLHSPSA
jgi:hypothetical protein